MYKNTWSAGNCSVSVPWSFCAQCRRSLLYTRAQNSGTGSKEPLWSLLELFLCVAPSFLILCFEILDASAFLNTSSTQRNYRALFGFSLSASDPRKYFLAENHLLFPFSWRSLQCAVCCPMSESCCFIYFVQCSSVYSRRTSLFLITSQRQEPGATNLVETHCIIYSIQTFYTKIFCSILKNIVFGDRSSSLF